MENIEQLNDSQKFIPGKQIVRVAYFTINDKGVKVRTNEWKGFLVSVTTRGLNLVPIDPQGYGESTDINAASWVSYPQFTNQNYEFIIEK